MTALRWVSILLLFVIVLFSAAHQPDRPRYQLPQPLLLAIRKSVRSNFRSFGMGTLPFLGLLFTAIVLGAVVSWVLLVGIENGWIAFLGFQILRQRTQQQA
jgi:hypothetical protein